MEIYDVMPFADLKICGSKEEAGLRNNSRVNQCLMVTGRKIKIAVSWVLPHARVARIVSLCRTGVKYIRKALPPLCACYDRDDAHRQRLARLVGHPFGCVSCRTRSPHGIRLKRCAKSSMRNNDYVPLCGYLSPESDEFGWSSHRYLVLFTIQPILLAFQISSR